MSDDFSKFPKNSVLSQLVMDIYSDGKEVTILYDRPFSQELLLLEYHKKSRELVFVFDIGKIGFGVPLKKKIAATMEKMSKIMLIQMNMKTKDAVCGLEVPLEVH